ncbi:MAG: DinB family protein [Gemmataceae bacterium]
MKKGDCLRKWVFSHTAHHRGILSAYLRLAGVPHTSIYER